jgi:hypothetical protein
MGATLALTLAALSYLSTPAAGAPRDTGSTATQTTETSDITTMVTTGCVVIGASCTTGAVRAHSTGFFVRYYVNGFGCSWRVRDVNSWRVVKSGTAWPSTTGIVEGLHGWYQLELGPICAPSHNGLLSNT